MLFRPAADPDLDGLVELAAHSFPSPERGRAWWRAYLGGGPHGGVDSVWVAEEEGELVGACQLLRLRQWIAGAALPVMGLGAVSVAPTHRRRGLAERLVVSGMEHARGRGDMASALYPFRIGYYQGLGYGLAGEAEQLRVAPRALPDAPEQRRRVRRVRGDADRAALAAVYHAAIRAQTGQVERTAGSWTRVLDGEQRAAVLYRDEWDEPQGYAVVRYRADLPPEQRFLDVEERLWLTDDARRGLDAWLASLGDQWRELAVRAHPDERLADRIAEPRLPAGAEPGWNLWFPSATVLRGPMFRLLDVPGALGARNIRPQPGVSLRVRVADQQVAANAGAWLVSLAGARPAVRPDEAGADAPTLSLDVRAMSRLFIGALTPSEAVRLGDARLDRPDLLPALDAALQVPRPWTWERF